MELRPELAALGFIESNMLTNEQEIKEYSEYKFITDSIAQYGELFSNEKTYDVSSSVKNILFRSSRHENFICRIENISRFLFRVPAIADKVAEMASEKKRLAAATAPFKLFNSEELENGEFEIKMRAVSNTFFINVKKNNSNYTGILKFIIKYGSKESNVIFDIKNGTAQITLLNENEVISNYSAEFWIAVD